VHENEYVYGPVLSRRLGRSLGINLLPIDRKICSFNCVYCECGPTTQQTLNPDPRLFPDPTDILLFLEKALKKPHSLDHVTLSGNGEPTLHPEFLEIAKAVVKLTRKYKPNARIALLSNASTLDRKEVLEALQLLDRVLLKLDAGNQKTFNAVNQPMVGIKLSNIIDHMVGLDNLVIQSAIFTGNPQNCAIDQLQEWFKALQKIKAKEVQIYTIERPAWHPGIAKYDQLEELAQVSRMVTGLNVIAYQRK
jgi:wyosine [tRNA(Phe)-imidazoG37] synthetase (radical SAM superfamily)